MKISNSLAVNKALFSSGKHVSSTWGKPKAPLVFRIRSVEEGSLALSDLAKGIIPLQFKGEKQEFEKLVEKAIETLEPDKPLEILYEFPSQGDREANLVFIDQIHQHLNRSGLKLRPTSPIKNIDPVKLEDGLLFERTFEFSLEGDFWTKFLLKYLLPIKVKKDEIGNFYLKGEEFVCRQLLKFLEILINKLGG